MNGNTDWVTRPYVAGSPAAAAIQSPMSRREHWWFVRAYRGLVPRMIQMTLVWVLFFTATATGWCFYLRHVDNVAADLEHETALAVGFYSIIVLAIGFIIIQDWASGTLRYQTTASNFLAINDLTSKVTHTIVRGIERTAAQERGRAPMQHLKPLVHIQHLLRAIPYTLLVYYRDMRLKQRQRTASIVSVIEAIVPREYYRESQTTRNRLGDYIDVMSIDEVPYQLYYAIGEQVRVLEADGLLDEKTCDAVREMLSNMGDRTSDLTRTVRVNYPKGGKNFITMSVAIYLFFGPFVVYDVGFAKTLVLNAVFVFIISGLLEIGRQIREPFENLIHNPYSDLPLFGESNRKARDNDLLFDDVHFRLATGSWQRTIRETERAAGGALGLADGSGARIYRELHLFESDKFAGEFVGPLAPLLNGVYDRIQLMLLDNDDCAQNDFLESPFKFATTTAR